MVKPEAQRIAEALDKVLRGQDLSYTVAFGLAQLKGADLWDLFAAAGRVRGNFR